MMDPMVTLAMAGMASLGMGPGQAGSGFHDFATRNETMAENILKGITNDVDIPDVTFYIL